MDIDRLRREYLHARLRRNLLLEDPIEQFKLWLQQAITAELLDPTAMSIATVGANGQPSQRVVLLKHCDARGFVFYTNLESRKAQEIADNAQVSLLFAWLPLERQVKICGEAEKLSTAQAIQYFITRPRDSQLAAWSSQQSHKISSRSFLEAEYKRIKEKFAEGQIPLPSFWGGYCVRPHEIEFWQGGENRLHDRFRYSRLGKDSWEINRLAP